MKNLCIVIENDIFVSDISNNVNTLFYIDYHGFCFPDDRWTDFAEPVLNMWTHELLKNRYSENIKFRLPFMDGPFWMTVNKGKNMQLIIDCINARGDQEISECTITCNYYDLLVILCDAIKSFNYMLYANGMYAGRFEPVYNQTIISMRELKKVIKNREIAY